MDFLIWIVTYIINEIKETDVYSGGHTNISIINKNGWRNIPKETILKHYDDGIQMICKGLSQSFKNKTWLKNSYVICFQDHNLISYSLVF